MFLLVPAYPGCPGSKAVKRSLFVVPAVSVHFKSTYSNIRLIYCVSGSLSRVEIERKMQQEKIDELGIHLC